MLHYFCCWLMELLAIFYTFGVLDCIPVIFVVVVIMFSLFRMGQPQRTKVIANAKHKTPFPSEVPYHRFCTAFLPFPMNSISPITNPIKYWGSL